MKPTDCVNFILAELGTAYRTTQIWVDNYAKDGGPGEVGLLCSFYHEHLRTWIK